MLHFPSANSAAHRPAARDVAKLSELLDDDVWAFSNCRVDAPGKPVAEIDWFFFNVRQGTLMVSEWKNFPQRVTSATDTGAPWLLEGGMAVANPIEQVSRQIATLHEELADLMVATACHVSGPAEPQAPATQPPATQAAAVSEQQRMQAHLTRSFKGVNGSAEAAARALEQAWSLVLSDPLLHGKSGISVSLFGSVGTPLIKQQHDSLKKVLGMQLREWCVLQATAAGLSPSDVPGKPSNIRVR